MNGQLQDFNGYPVTKLNAVLKKDISSNTPVIHKDEFEYWTWVHVPHEISREFEAFEIHEMEEPIKEFCMATGCSHYRRHPWYRLRSDMLCKCPGLHIYRMHLVNPKTDDVISLFFGYHVQDDDPKKPYIYMDPSERCACCSHKEREV